MWLFARFGRRKTWHFIGVLMNLVSVPLLYNRCALGLCESAPQWSQFFYYAVLGIINQAGWAASQVRHRCDREAVFHLTLIITYRLSLSLF